MFKKVVPDTRKCEFEHFRILIDKCGVRFFSKYRAKKVRKRVGNYRSVQSLYRDTAKNYLAEKEAARLEKEFNLPRTQVDKINRFYEYLTILHPYNVPFTYLVISLVPKKDQEYPHPRLSYCPASGLQGTRVRYHLQIQGEEALGCESGAETTSHIQ